MNSRIKKLISTFKEQKMDAFLITDSPSISYLTHFPSEESWLFVTTKKAYYITDSRYALVARQGLKGIPIKVCKGSLITESIELMNKMKGARVGLNSQSISVFTYKKLRQGCLQGIRLIIYNKGIVEQMREIKFPDEVARIKKAISLTHKAYQYLKRVIKPGMTEHQIFLKLERFVKDLGYSFSFQPIIASGPNSCHPHAKISSRKVRRNDVVLVDMGIDVDGYKSDLTRMFFLGKIPPHVSEVARFVSDAQNAAIDKIHPGVKASFIDQQARNFLKERKLSKYFGHSLGHGVGLEIHEGPGISQNSQTILKPGMIFTVEPAVYIPNKFGIRIEDMVLVTEKGCQILSR